MYSHCSEFKTLTRHCDLKHASSTLSVTHRKPFTQTHLHMTRFAPILPAGRTRNSLYA